MANQLVSSSSFSSTPSWKYDVFLSFRGKDTRTNFTDHLYHALDRHGIHTFIDHELPSGEEMSLNILEAIEKSRISVIVFSENYASSKWCLDELVHIIECRKSKGQMTRPIFYKVDPSDVRYQRNSYGAAFADHSRKYENNLEKVQSWRTALSEAASLKGAILKEGEYETTCIDRIVEEISVQVSNRTCLNVAKYPVGIESCAKEVEELLGVGGNDRRVVGIWGTSGIGKTTIAKAVYNAIAHKFEGNCFLADVRETSATRDGVIQLQNTLLSEILWGTELKIVNACQGISLIKKRLRQKKIILILDDVDELEQLKNWVDIDCFDEGSRVIITTKDRSLLDFYGGQWIYEVQKLEDDEALELFSWNAFERNKPPDDYLSLARRAIAYAQGLPLALNLIGSYMRKKSLGRWQAVLDSYDSYEREPYRGIQTILRKSYDALDSALQQVFLDIACFFKGERECYVLNILRSSKLYVPQDCLEVLVAKAIITIHDRKIWMHDLLQMGKRIVREESPTEPGKRNRLWDHEDVYHVLTKNRGTEKIRVIVVELPEPDVIPLNAESFLPMINLEIFINRNAQFSGCVNYLPNDLRWIELGPRSDIHRKHTVVFNLPPDYRPKHLVSFAMPYSGIKQLNGFKNLAKLTCMDLSDCKFLKKIPDLSGSPSIESLYLDDCKSLVEVDDSIGFLDKLEVLSLEGCSKLTRFATRLRMRSLIRLYLNRCTSLESFPKIEDKMESLTYLGIQKSGIRELPSSIAYLTGLRTLEAEGCANLTKISDLSGSRNIKFLHLDDCKSLVEVDDSTGFLDELEVLSLGGCSKLTRFSTRLGLKAKGCAELTNICISDYPKLITTDVDILDILDDKRITHLPNLYDLDLTGNNLSEIDFLGKFVDLYKLRLSGSKRLREIRVLPPELVFIYLDDCTSLEKIPKLPLKLSVLDLTNCFRLCEVAKLENNLLNEESLRCYHFQVVLPGNEVPKWFNYTSNHPTIIEHLPEYLWKVYHKKEEFVRGSEFCFEIPQNLQLGETLTRLVVSFVFEPPTCHRSTYIFVDGELASIPHLGDSENMKATHVWLKTCDLVNLAIKPDIRQVTIACRKGVGIKSCGVHLLLRNQDELLHLSLGPTTSFGKRPCPRGSSDIVDDECDQQQRLSLSSKPADDHPKRRRIDLNVPIDIEEEDEQEKPSTLDDPQFLIY